MTKARPVYCECGKFVMWLPDIPGLMEAIAALNEKEAV